MNSQIYEVAALGARYWFVLLGVLIVLRAFFWLFRDRHAKHERLRSLPDAGMIGEMVVLDETDDFPENTLLPIPREGTIGAGRSCDLCLPVHGVSDLHLRFLYREGDGLLLFPARGQTILVNDRPMTHRNKSADFGMHHGDVLTVGNIRLMLRLFAGLDTEYHPPLSQELPSLSQETRFFSPGEEANRS